jgi:putative SOS response-associated peptidase YedK
VIRRHPKEPRRDLSLIRWGLIPSWSKDASGAARMINARSETVHSLPSFRDAIKLRRCLIPADGFYEWKRTGVGKQPYCFEVNDGDLFAFAGLWDRWRDAGGQWIRSFSVLTTTANSLTCAVHDRMPVILNKNDYDRWLDPGMTKVEAVSELLTPFDGRLMRSFPVSPRINQVANDDEACSVPVEFSEPQPGLF